MLIKTSSKSKEENGKEAYLINMRIKRLNRKKSKIKKMKRP